jgi:hypothetical protein
MLLRAKNVLGATRTLIAYKHQSKARFFDVAFFAGNAFARQLSFGSDSPLKNLPLI